MRLSNKLLIFILAINAIFFTYAYAEKKTSPPSFVIFDSDNPINADYQLCNNENAKHGIRIEENSNRKKYLRWRWARKRNSWCGFGIQNFSYIGNNLEEYENDFSLTIKLKGKWTRISPQIKFIDKSKASTKLVRIEKYLYGDPESLNGATVKIPLKDFDIGWSINIKNVETLQFDAAYESDAGDIKIYYIRIEKVAK